MRPLQPPKPGRPPVRSSAHVQTLHLWKVRLILDPNAEFEDIFDIYTSWALPKCPQSHHLDPKWGPYSLPNLVVRPCATPLPLEGPIRFIFDPNAEFEDIFDIYTLWSLLKRPHNHHLDPKWGPSASQTWSSARQPVSPCPTPPPLEGPIRLIFDPKVEFEDIFGIYVSWGLPKCPHNHHLDPKSGCIIPNLVIRPHLTRSAFGRLCQTYLLLKLIFLRLFLTSILNADFKNAPMWSISRQIKASRTSQSWLSHTPPPPSSPLPLRLLFPFHLSLPLLLPLLLSLLLSLLLPLLLSLPLLLPLLLSLLLPLLLSLNATICSIPLYLVRPSNALLISFIVHMDLFNLYLIAPFSENVKNALEIFIWTSYKGLGTFQKWLSTFLYAHWYICLLMAL